MAEMAEMAKEVEEVEEADQPDSGAVRQVGASGLANGNGPLALNHKGPTHSLEREWW